MQKFNALLLAAALIASVAVFAPAPAQASFACNLCAQTEDCFACCKCEGGGALQCSLQCGPAVATEGEITLASDDEALTCSESAPAATEEAPSIEETPSVAEATPAAS